MTMSGLDLNWKSTSEETYPRPDWVHEDTRFALLDGPWSFLFDDDNEGAAADWGSSGLPTKASKHAQRTINVPYAFQAPASGINAPYEPHEYLWYERTFRLPGDKDQHAALHFGAVDYEASVYLDGIKIGEHQGGHVSFSVVLTPYLKEAEHTYRLTVQVRDPPYDLEIPRGKQYWVLDGSASIFYTPTSGIWQSVWIELSPLNGSKASPPRINARHSVLRTDVAKGQLLSWVAVEGEAKDVSASVEVHLAGVSLGTSAGVKVVPISSEALLEKPATLTHSVVVPTDVRAKLPTEFQQAHPETSTTSQVLKQWRDDRKQGQDNLLEQAAWSDQGVALWSPRHPILYDVTLTLTDSSGQVLDVVHTSIGARTIEWNPIPARQEGGKQVQPKGALRLNGLPYFHCLMLDQGYWLETNLTPPDDGAVGGTKDVNTGLALKRDIELGKAMGFDGVRKHQKVEDPRFLYWADRLGFLVWGEFANAYEWSESYAKRIEHEWPEVVQRDRNHASIVAWTPVNESWAYTDLEQRDDKGELTALAQCQREHIGQLVQLTKRLDPTRPVNDNCGWQHVAGDLASFHDYSEASALYETCRHLIPTQDGQSAILGIKDEGRRVMFVPSPNTPQASVQSHTYDGNPLPRGFLPGMPVINTEFGGINISQSLASKQQTKEVAATSGLHLGIGGDYSGSEWGYTTASSAQELLTLIRRAALALVGVEPGSSNYDSAKRPQQGIRGQEGAGSAHLCGMVYTQLADCEQEVNGLLTNDRKMKLPAQELQAVLDDLRKVYFASLGDWV